MHLFLSEKLIELILPLQVKELCINSDICNHILIIKCEFNISKLDMLGGYGPVHIALPNQCLVFGRILDLYEAGLAVERFRAASPSDSGVFLKKVRDFLNVGVVHTFQVDKSLLLLWVFYRFFNEFNKPVLRL